MNERLFVRHGQSKYNAGFTKNLDSDLTPIGIQQATAAGNYLRDNIPDIKEFSGVTSPYHRCLQTAEIIHDITGMQFQVKALPREDMTTYDECRVVNRKDVFDKFHWDEDHSNDFHFQKETIEEFFDRMKKYIEGENHPKLLVVSHASPILLMHHILLGHDDVWKIMDKRLNFPTNCSISHIKEKESVRWNHVPWDTSILA